MSAPFDGADHRTGHLSRTAAGQVGELLLREALSLPRRAKKSTDLLGRGERGPPLKLTSRSDSFLSGNISPEMTPFQSVHGSEPPKSRRKYTEKQMLDDRFLARLQRSRRTVPAVNLSSP